MAYYRCIHCGKKVSSGGYPNTYNEDKNECPERQLPRISGKTGHEWKQV
jgi:hypothetical protein